MERVPQLRPDQCWTELPLNLYSWFFIFMLILSAWHYWFVLMNCNLQVLFWKCHCSSVCFALEYCSSAWSPGLVPNEFNPVFLKHCVPDFLISICTNAVLLQLQFLSPSAAYFQFSYRIINGTQNWCRPRIEYLFDTSLHHNGHNSPVRRCLLHIFMSLTAFAVFYRNAAGNRI